MSPTTQASCRGSAFGLEFGFDDLLRVVPGTTGIGHEDGLVQAEDRDGDQVADKEERLGEGEGESREEDGEEDVEHALLRVLRADFNTFLESSTLAFSAPSSLMLSLMNSTAR